MLFKSVVVTDGAKILWNCFAKKKVESDVELTHKIIRAVALGDSFSAIFSSRAEDTYIMYVKYHDLVLVCHCNREARTMTVLSLYRDNTSPRYAVQEYIKALYNKAIPVGAKLTEERLKIADKLYKDNARISSIYENDYKMVTEYSKFAEGGIVSAPILWNTPATAYAVPCKDIFTPNASVQNLEVGVVNADNFKDSDRDLI